MIFYPRGVEYKTFKTLISIRGGEKKKTNEKKEG